MTGALLERDRELTMLRARLADAQSGRGAVVMLDGPAGSGKSALLRAVRDVARDGGLRVGVAVGGELERDFPFGIARQLLEPLLAGLTPGGRTQLLSGAAGGAAMVLGAAGSPPLEGGGDALFTVLHGLYWLVANLAETTPLALLVDDAHWGDETSLRFLEFLARRAPELPVLVLIAARPAEPGAPQGLLDALAETAGADVVHPAPLSVTAVRTLVREGVGGVDPQPAVADAAHATTGGNPLLLRELIRALAADGGPPTVAGVRRALPSSVVRSVSLRLARLAPEERRLAQALSLVGRFAETELIAAVAGLDPSAVLSGLQALRALELIAGDPPGFVHPLVRAAIAEDIDAGEQVVMHRAAADHLRRHDGDLDQLLLHVLAAGPIGEPWAVSALRRGARQALAEGAGAAAVTRLRRARGEAVALGIPLDELELELGVALVGEGDPGCLVHLEAAVASARDDIAAEALRVTLGSGLYSDVANLARLADRGEEVMQRTRRGPAISQVRLEPQVFAVLVQSPLLTERRMRMLASATRAAPGWELATLLAIEGFNQQEPAARTAALCDRVLAAGPFAEVSRIEQPLAMYALETAMALDRVEGWPAAIATAEGVARRSGSRLAHAFVAFIHAEWNVARGSVASAEARARSALEHFVGYGETTTVAGVRGALTAALVRRGRLEEAEAILADAPADDELSETYSGLFVFPRRAELRMAQRRPVDAVADLERLAELVGDYRWHRWVQGYHRPLHARALIAVGRREEGRELAEAEVVWAETQRIAGAHAQALIALAQALDPAAALEALEAALRVAAGASDEVGALAAYAFGAALRRAGKRTDARRELTAARELATRIDGMLLAEAATAELIVAGGRPRRVRAAGVESLTPSERRVAEHAAAGLSNREIAETLFVTRKTVELHLGNVFGKLSIRSRTQIAGILDGREDPGARPV
jgi:DNA-binding NarL/FixJ family response regulator